MTSTSRIAELAALIQSKTAVFDGHITKSGLPSPSFDASQPPMLELPPDITQARDAALEAIDELQALLLGPVGSLFHELTVNNTKLVSLHAVTHFNLAKTFAANETTTVEELAESASLDKEDVRRIVRHAHATRLFSEPSKGVIGHTATSQAIVNVPFLSDWVEETCSNMWSSAPRIVDAMAKWPGSEEPNETAFNLAHATPLPFFPAISQNQKSAKRFADAMSFFQANPTMSTALIVDNYDWAAHASGTVVDVGGSHGAVAVELAKRFSEMTCVVQDLPEVIEAAPKDAPSQVRFDAYDFFTEQPVKGADLYLFRMIFHNWGDKYCVKILQNLIPALKKGAKIVINDHVVPEPGILSPYQDRSVRGFDLVMKEMFNAKERDVNDWTSLLTNTDERFKILDVKRPVGSQLQIIEVEWSG